jgi:ribonuclease P protein component
MFKAVLEKGKSLKSPPLSLRYLRGDSVDMTRLGFIVRKKTGNAVLRNSMRRVLREIFRKRLDTMPALAWLVFDVHPQASTLTRDALRLKGEDLLNRLATLPTATALPATAVNMTPITGKSL